jgi:hypothetical protein
VKYSIISGVLTALGFVAIAFAADKPAATPPLTVQQQELGAMQQLCQLAEWANRQQADTICPYFLDKFSKAVEKKP